MEIIFCLKYIYTSMKYYHEKENDEISIPGIFPVYIFITKNKCADRIISSELV